MKKMVMIAFAVASIAAGHVGYFATILMLSEGAVAAIVTMVMALALNLQGWFLVKLAA